MSFSTTVLLSNEHKWNEVFPNMEMCARKRNKFCPELSFIFQELSNTDSYEVVLSMERYDNIRYAFSNGEWHASTVRKPIPPEPVKYVKHPLGIRPGNTWMKSVITFSDIRLTNKCAQPDNNLFVLTTMHKYVPVVTVCNHTTAEILRFPMEAAQFIPVTEYLSDAVSVWKVRNNKFATFKNRERGKRKASAMSTGEPAAKRIASISPPSNSLVPSHCERTGEHHYQMYHSPYYHYYYSSPHSTPSPQSVYFGENVPMQQYW